MLEVKKMGMPLISLVSKNEDSDDVVLKFLVNRLTLKTFLVG